MFRHGFGAEASLPLSKCAPALSYNASRHIYIYIYVCVCVCVCVCMCVCVCVYVRARVCACCSVYTYVYTSMYAYIYTSINIRVDPFLIMTWTINIRSPYGANLSSSGAIRNLNSECSFMKTLVPPILMNHHSAIQTKQKPNAEFPGKQ